MEPLLTLTRGAEAYCWGEAQQIAFEQLRTAIATCTTLQFPNPRWKFCLTTDASNVGLGAELSQVDDSGKYNVIAFASRSLSPAERKLATIEKECLAIVWAVSQWRHYLLGKEFEIRSDHKPLQWLRTMKDNNPKLTRWALKLGIQLSHLSHQRVGKPSRGCSFKTPYL